MSKGYITRAELLQAALKDPDFRMRYEECSSPFARLLGEMRAHAGLTQQEVAERSGYGRPLVSMAESGTLANSRWNTMVAIAKACGFRLVLTAEKIENGKES